MPAPAHAPHWIDVAATPASRIAAHPASTAAFAAA